MFVINEDGTAAVNLDQCVLVGLGNNDQGETILVAQMILANGSQVSYTLASAGDRPMRAAQKITEALKAGKRLLDLNDILGARPDIVVPKGTLLGPNGKPT